MMNKLCIIGLVVAALMLLSACESGAQFQVRNNCNYPAYASVDSGTLITIPGGENHIFKLGTDTQSIFTGKVTRTIPVTLYGETYSLFDDWEGQYTDNTTITVQAGETLTAFLNPNRASIKVVNNSQYPIDRAVIRKTSLSTYNPITVGTITDIAPGDSLFRRVDPALPNNQFYYEVLVYAYGIEYPYLYGGEDTILVKDEQFQVVYTDPE